MVGDEAFRTWLLIAKATLTATERKVLLELLDGEPKSHRGTLGPEPEYNAHPRQIDLCQVRRA